MKQLCVILILLVCACTATADREDKGTVETVEKSGNSSQVELDKIMASPEHYVSKTIIVEGIVGKVCQQKGCWIELQSGKASIHITFKDSNFSVPINSQGMKVKAEGEVVITTIDKKTIDRIGSLGSSIKRNADGTGSQVTFIASEIKLMN